MKVTGRTECDMGRDRTFITMEISILGSGSMIANRGKEH